MAELSKYENVAQDFLKEFPIGTDLTAERLLKWLEQKANGHIIGSDLSIEDPRRKLSAVRRHLNEGARSQNVAEDHRFVLQVTDAKRGRFAVVSYMQHAHMTAAQAFLRSAGGAMAPIKGAYGILEDIKVEELSDDEKQQVDRDRKNLEALKEPLQKMYNDEADRRMVGALVDRGQTEQQARLLLESMSTLGPLQSLRNKLSW